jgi:hypothetical protein
MAGFGCRVVQVRKRDLDHAREILGLEEQAPQT